MLDGSTAIHSRSAPEVIDPCPPAASYQAGKLDKVIEAIHHTGYGLTFGVYTHIDSVAAYVQSRMRVGNSYANRNTIGAVVGVQAFGAPSFYSTDPKADGPDYLDRFAVQRTPTINTAAVGDTAVTRR